MRLVFHIVICVVAAFASLPAAAAQYLDKVAAVVNGEMITLYDVNEKIAGYLRSPEGGRIDQNDPRIMAELRGMALQSMIDDILVRQEAKRLQVNITDTDLEKELRQMFKRTGMTERQFEAQLKAENMTRKEFLDSMRKDLIKQQLLSYMVQRKVLVTEDDIKKAGGSGAGAPASSSNQPQLTVTGVRLGLIILPKADVAKDVRKKIVAKELSFADAARRYSVGPAKEEGGDLGFIAFKDMSPELSAAAKGLSPGAVSDVVVLEGKPALVTVSDVRQEKTAMPADAPAAPGGSDGMYERLFRSKAEKQFRDYMAKLRAKAVIDIKL